jgi:hypothetical protein
MSCRLEELWNNLNSPGSSGLKTVVYLAGWAVSAFLSMVDLWLVQQMVIDVAVWIGSLRSAEDRLRDLYAGKAYGWTVETVSMISLLVLLMLAVGFEIWVEYFYRRGTTLSVLFTRILKVSLGQGLIAAASVLIAVILKEL